MSKTGVSGVGRAQFKKRSPDAIGGLDPKARAVIEALQPYQLGSAYKTHPLWVLNELSRRDKHRFKFAAVASGNGVRFNGPGHINLAGHPAGEWKVHSAILEVGKRTPLVSMPVRPIDPDQPVRLNIQPNVDVGFGAGTPLVAGRPVLDILAGLHNYIVDEVLPRLELFLK
jgi:hypothetical protein